MSVSAIAAAAAGSHSAQTRAALGTEVIKQQHQAEQGVVNLIEQAVEAGKQASGSSTAPGTGHVVDVKA